MDAPQAEQIAKLADELVAAGTGLAGLILVFIGTTAASFDTTDGSTRNLIRPRYRFRIWLAFAGFAASLVSVFAVLAYSDTRMEALLTVAMWFLIAAFLVSLVLAFLTAKGIG